jgi:NADPH:quinone reductase-like Zn-dependent oxidoreductase
LKAKPFFIRIFSGLLKPKNTILGNEFAGKIEAVGKEVKTFKVGNNVFGYTGLKLGTHTEYLVIAENKMVAKMPSNMTFDEAAASTEGGHYALSDIRKANVKKGQNVLIYGASGAIGSAAVQIIKSIGAQVTAVCSTKNVALVKSLGADKVIDYTKEDFTKCNQKFDFIFDAVGKISFRKCNKLLRKDGIYCSSDLGYLAQNPLLAFGTSIFGDKKVIMPFPKEGKEEILFLKEIMEKGLYKPVIDRSYPLQKVAEAFRYVETGKKIGNVIIKVT